MKRIHISHAGCSPELVKKLKLAANLLSSQGYTVSTDSWRGVATQLLVVNERDSFGAKVSRLAQKNEISLLKVGALVGGGALPGEISEEESVHAIYKAMHGRLSGESHARKAPPSTAQSHPEIARLLSAKSDVVELTIAPNRFVVFDFSAGLCRAQNQADMASGQQALASGKALSISPIAKPDPKTMGCQASIEHYVFHALLKSASVAFDPETPVKLRVWPDIACRQEGASIAAVSSMLMRAPSTIDSLSGEHKMNVLNAYFWAVTIARLNDEAAIGDGLVNGDSNASEGKVKKVLAKFVSWLGGS